jgi:hypothetical protein
MPATKLAVRGEQVPLEHGLLGGGQPQALNPLGLGELRARLEQAEQPVVGGDLQQVQVVLGPQAGVVAARQLVAQPPGRVDDAFPCGCERGLVGGHAVGGGDDRAGERRQVQVGVQLRAAVVPPAAGEGVADRAVRRAADRLPYRPPGERGRGGRAGRAVPLGGGEPLGGGPDRALGAALGLARAGERAVE